MSAIEPVLRVDREAAVIRDVSVITGGVQAKGHDLWTDDVTLQQIAERGNRMGQVLVKENHRKGGESTGVDAAIGYLTDFRIVGAQVRADLHLYPSHPRCDLYLDIAERSPNLMGLSAAFVPDEQTIVIDGKRRARVQDLVTVDLVTQPAANPLGLFEASEVRPRVQPHVASAEDRLLELIAVRSQQLLERIAPSRRDNDERRNPSHASAAGAASGGVLGAAAALRSARGRSLRPNEQPRIGDVVERSFWGGAARHRGVVVPGGVAHAARPKNDPLHAGRADIVVDSLRDFARNRPLTIHPGKSPEARNVAATNARASVGTKGRYHVVVNNSDSMLRSASGAKFPTQIPRAIAGGLAGATAGYVAARWLSKHRSEKKQMKTTKFSSNHKVATDEQRAEQRRRSSEIRRRIRAAISATGAGAAIGAAVAANPWRGGRFGAGIGAGASLLAPGLFQSAASAEREFAYGEQERDDRRGLFRKAATGALGAYAGSQLGQSAFVRTALRKVAAAVIKRRPGKLISGIAGGLARNGGLVGGVLGGLAGLALEANERRPIAFFEAAAEDGGVTVDSDTLKALESLSQDYVHDGGREAVHSLESLSRRTMLSTGEIAQLIEMGALSPSDDEGDGLVRFRQRDVEDVRRAVVEEKIAEAIRIHGKSPSVKRDGRVLVYFARRDLHEFLAQPHERNE